MLRLMGVSAPSLHRESSDSLILNLPREIRYKRENVILVGLIPSPKEPPLTITSYISPLVSELLELRYGVIMERTPSREGFLCYCWCWM